MVTVKTSLLRRVPLNTFRALGQFWFKVFREASAKQTYFLQVFRLDLSYIKGG